MDQARRHSERRAETWATQGMGACRLKRLVTDYRGQVPESDIETLGSNPASSAGCGLQ